MEGSVSFSFFFSEFVSNICEKIDNFSICRNSDLTNFFIEIFEYVEFVIIVV